jgi:hypothetical protein
MDRAAANLAKLDSVWERAQPHIPTGPSAGSNREYDDLCRHWDVLLGALPKVDGWTVTEPLPDIDAAGRALIDYLDIGEPPFSLMNDLEEPGRQLDEYRFALGQARRRAVNERIQELIRIIEARIERVVADLPHDSEPFETPDTQQVRDGFRELDRLLGDTTERRGRWYDMGRHLHFSQPGDWRDIVDMDWPDIRANLESMALTELDPIPVADMDLGQAARSHPSGGVTTDLGWANLNEDGFERLLYDLLRGFPDYQNVQWLMKTHAPDRGRDLSLERVIRDPSGLVRTERVIVQAKHFTSKSVGPNEIQQSLAPLPLWEPPAVRALVIATSGRFSSDAIGVVEKHNNDGKTPLIELWPNSQLEAMLARRPDLVEAHNLRT